MRAVFGGGAARPRLLRRRLAAQGGPARGYMHPAIAQMMRHRMAGPPMPVQPQATFQGGPQIEGGPDFHYPVPQPVANPSVPGPGGPSLEGGPAPMPSGGPLPIMSGGPTAGRPGPMPPGVLPPGILSGAGGSSLPNQNNDVYALQKKMALLGRGGIGAGFLGGPTSAAGAGPMDPRQLAIQKAMQAFVAKRGAY